LLLNDATVPPKFRGRPTPPKSRKALTNVVGAFFIRSPGKDGLYLSSYFLLPVSLYDLCNAVADCSNDSCHCKTVCCHCKRVSCNCKSVCCNYQRERCKCQRACCNCKRESCSCKRVCCYCKREDCNCKSDSMHCLQANGLCKGGFELIFNDFEDFLFSYMPWPLLFVSGRRCKKLCVLLIDFWHKMPLIIN